MRKIFLWSYVYSPDSPTERVLIVMTESDYDIIIKSDINIIYQEENMSRFTFLFHLNEKAGSVDDTVKKFKKNEFLTDASESMLCKLRLLLD